MDLYSSTAIRNDVQKMIQSQHASGSELRSLNFGSFQASFITSCVPPFNCGPIPKTCGISSKRYSSAKAISQAIKEQKETPIKSGNHSSSYTWSAEKSSHGSRSVPDVSTAEVTVNNQLKLVSPLESCISVASSSHVVITQPKSGETTSSKDPLLFKTHRRQSEIDHMLSENNNTSSVGWNDSNKMIVSDSDSSTQMTDVVIQTKLEPSNQNKSTLSSESNIDLSTPVSSQSSPSKSSLKEKDYDSEEQSSDNWELFSFQNSKQTMFTSENSRGKKPNFSVILSDGEPLSSSSNVLHKAQKESKRSTSTSPPREGSRTNGCTKSVDTQKLFTPDDLSKELLRPNPSETKLEIFQNLNAREAGFVLHRPKRKPRDSPLPPNFRLNTGLQSKGHFIEPLATEDEVALREGSKELMENGHLVDSQSTFYNPYDFSLCEAVNFELENSIDNFDREEYIRFKRIHDSDVEVSNIPDTSVLLTDIIQQHQSKKIQLNGKKKETETRNLSSDGKFQKQRSFPKDAGSALRGPPNISNPKIDTDLGFKTISKLEQKEPQYHSVSSRSEKFSVVNRTKNTSKSQTRETQTDLLRPLSSSHSYENVIKATKQNVSKSRSTNESLFAYSIFKEDLTDQEKSSSLTKTKSLEFFKLEPEHKVTQREKHRRKKSTKLYKNIKYYKIKSHSHTSLDFDSKKAWKDNSYSDSSTSQDQSETNFDLDDILNKQDNQSSSCTLQGTPVTPTDILEEVQSNLKARLASLDDLDSLVENMEDEESASDGQSLFPYKPLLDVSTSISPVSLTPPSSMSPTSVRDWSIHKGDTREKKKKRRHSRAELMGRRGSDKPTKDVKALHKRPPPSWSSSSSSDESTLSLHSPKSSSRISSSSSSTSSSSDSTSSSSSIESSDNESLLI